MSIKRLKIRNTFKTPMRFYMEPKGQDISIPGGAEFVLEFPLQESDSEIGTIDIGFDHEGIPCAALWAGEYKTLINGVNAWDIIANQQGDNPTA